ncbi:MAG: rod shape-determining protein MreC [Deltaproteobacteria bacterium]|nr:rod shape-determining protein MreC [Deltaproteobacteria bacterium]
MFLVLFFASLLSGRVRRAPWYEQWAWNAVSPVVSVFSWVSHGTGDVWRHYIYLAGTAKKNELLTREVERLRQNTAVLEELRQENKRLQKLLGLARESFPESVAAQVIAFDPAAEFKTIVINKGGDDGIQSDMPVVSTAGLVGKVGPVFNRHALVLLIVDPASSVDVLDLRSRVRGILSGRGKNTELRPGYFLSRLEYVKQTSDIQEGDTLVTSGLDRLFPKGIAVGTIHKIIKGKYGIFTDAEVVPMVDFSQLEEVLVLQ